MKPSSFAAVVFIAIGIFGTWRIVQYKRAADAKQATAGAASSGDAGR